MKRTPRKMRKREREELERLFTQLMRDLAAVRAPPLEWTLRSTRGPLRCSLWSEMPAVKCRSPSGGRWTWSRPIGPALPLFVDLVTWICGLLQNPEPGRKEPMAIEQVNNLFLIAGTIKATGQRVYWEGFDDLETAEEVERLIKSGDLRFRVGYPVDRLTGEQTEERETWVSPRARIEKLAEIRSRLQKASK